MKFRYDDPSSSGAAPVAQFAAAQADVAAALGVANLHIDPAVGAGAGAGAGAASPAAPPASPPRERIKIRPQAGVQGSDAGTATTRASGPPGNASASKDAGSGGAGFVASMERLDA